MKLPKANRIFRKVCQRKKNLINLTHENREKVEASFRRFDTKRGKANRSVYSTFNLKPYLYIHDVVVLDGFRGKGIGRALINEWKRISKERDYCKITLEVREDNHNALHLYNSLGFVECDPKMYFWTCKL